MNTYRLIGCLAVVLIGYTASTAQKSPVTYEKEAAYGSPDDESLPLWARKMYSDDPNMFEVVTLYKSYYQTHPFVKNQHTQYFKRWKKHAAPFVNAGGLIRPPLKTERDSLQWAFLDKKKQKAIQKMAGETAVGVADWQCVGPFDFDKDAAGTSHAPGAARQTGCAARAGSPDRRSIRPAVAF